MVVWRSPRRLWQGFWRRFCRIWMSGGGACWWGRRLSCWVVAAGPRWRSCRGCLVRRWPRAPTRSRRGLRCLGGNGRRVGAPNRRWRLSPVCSRLWMRWWTHRLGVAGVVAALDFEIDLPVGRRAGPSGVPGVGGTGATSVTSDGIQPPGAGQTERGHDASGPQRPVRLSQQSGHRPSQGG